MMPMPPSWARAMASSLSVTVSIGEETIGMLRRMLRVSCGADVDVAGHDVAVAGLEQDVVEGDALVCDAVVHERPPAKRDVLEFGIIGLAPLCGRCNDFLTALPG